MINFAQLLPYKNAYHIHTHYFKNEYFKLQKMRK